MTFDIGIQHTGLPWSYLSKVLRSLLTVTGWNYFCYVAR